MEDKYILKDSATNYFIRIDETSGGYPSDTTFMYASTFSLEGAKQYRDTMHKKWDIYKIIHNENSISWEKVNEEENGNSKLIFNNWKDDCYNEEKSINLPDKINYLGFFYDGGRVTVSINNKQVFYSYFGGNDCAVEINRNK